jgi:hypothetical protein
MEMLEIFSHQAVKGIALGIGGDLGKLSAGEFIDSDDFIQMTSVR